MSTPAEIARRQGWRVGDVLRLPAQPPDQRGVIRHLGDREVLCAITSGAEVLLPRSWAEEAEVIGPACTFCLAPATVLLVLEEVPFEVERHRLCEGCERQGRLARPWACVTAFPIPRRYTVDVTLIPGRTALVVDAVVDGEQVSVHRAALAGHDEPLDVGALATAERLSIYEAVRVEEERHGKTRATSG